MMRRLLIVLTGAILLAIPAAARGWTPDYAASRLGFAAAMNGVGFEGRFQNWRADIVFDPLRLSEAQVMVTVDMSSANTEDATRDAALPGDLWFDAGKHPNAVFEARVFTQTGDGQYQAQGTLTLRGASQPLTLPFSLQIDGNTAKMQAQVTFDRRLWSVGTGPYAGDTPVAAEVTVRVDLTATSP